MHTYGLVLYVYWEHQCNICIVVCTIPDVLSSLHRKMSRKHVTGKLAKFKSCPMFTAHFMGERKIKPTLSNCNRLYAQCTCSNITHITKVKFKHEKLWLPKKESSFLMFGSCFAIEIQSNTTSVI